MAAVEIKSFKLHELNRRITLKSICLELLERKFSALFDSFIFEKVFMSSSNRTFKEKIILGIDPGTNVMGYGAVLVQGQELSHVSMGAIHLKDPDPAIKLKMIFEKTLWLIDENKPDEMAFEAPFFGKNVQSMLKLGRAQGVSMAAALYRGLPIAEYSPRKVKQSITGSGAASKEQVAKMLQSLLKLETLPKSLDATDGMAVALCHHFQSTSPISSSKGKSWDAFIKSNPDRIS